MSSTRIYGACGCQFLMYKRFDILLKQRHELQTIFSKTMLKNVSIRKNAVSNFDTFTIEINVFGKANANLYQFLTTICLKYKNKLLIVWTLNNCICIQYSLSLELKVLNSFLENIIN